MASAEEVGKVKALVDLVAAMTKEAKDPVLPEELELFLVRRAAKGPRLPFPIAGQLCGL